MSRLTHIEPVADSYRYDVEGEQYGKGRMDITECGIYEAENLRCNEGAVCSYGSHKSCNQ